MMFFASAFYLIREQLKPEGQSNIKEFPDLNSQHRTGINIGLIKTEIHLKLDVAFADVQRFVSIRQQCPQSGRDITVLQC